MGKYFLAALGIILAFWGWDSPGARAVTYEVLTQPGSSPELRALWVTRWTLTDPEAVRNLVRRAADSHFNALFLQVNGQGEAYYRSELLPREQELPPDFDPLQVALDEAHARGLEVHAWINALNVGSFGVPLSSELHVLKRHPEWVVTDARGKTIWQYDSRERRNLAGYFLEPGYEGVREYLQAVVAELVRNYAVDGVHLDYIRYPGRQMGYSPENREAFRLATGYDPVDLFRQGGQLQEQLGPEEFRALKEEWDLWRSRQVTEVVRRVYQTVAAIRPQVKVSAAVFPDPVAARAEYFQDWPTWLHEGIVDFVALMAYSTDTEVVERQVRAAVAVAGERPVYAGIGAYQLLRPASIVEKIEAARRAGASGVILFDYRTVAARGDLLEKVAQETFSEKVQVPVLPWKSQRAGIPGGDAQQVVQQLSVEEKVGQMLLLTLEGPALSPEQRSLLAQGWASGVLLRGDPARTAPGAESADPLLARLARDVREAGFLSPSLVPPLLLRGPFTFGTALDAGARWYRPEGLTLLEGPAWPAFSDGDATLAIRELQDGLAGPEAGFAAVEAIAAGADLLILPPGAGGEEVHRVVLWAVRAGRLPLERLDRSVERILEVKAHLGLWHGHLAAQGGGAAAPPAEPAEAGARGMPTGAAKGEEDGAAADPVPGQDVEPARVD
ncbi:MAG: family 10 glycosylhydrolase [Bacillota bacterium]|nr:family 10 glycosylhydrolase [Bacillota bacterium]